MVHRDSQLLGDLLVTASFEASQAKNLGLLTIQLSQRFPEMLAQFGSLDGLEWANGFAIKDGEFGKLRAACGFSVALA